MYLYINFCKDTEGDKIDRENWHCKNDKIKIKQYKEIIKKGNAK